MSSSYTSLNVLLVRAVRTFQKYMSPPGYARISLGVGTEDRAAKASFSRKEEGNVGRGGELALPVSSESPAVRKSHRRGRCADCWDAFSKLEPEACPTLCPITFTVGETRYPTPTMKAVSRGAASSTTTAPIAAHTTFDESNERGSETLMLV